MIDSDGEMETTEKLLAYYKKSNIYYNYPNFYMIWKIVKEERRALHAIISLLNKSKLPYSSTNYLFIEKVS